MLQRGGVYPMLGPRRVLDLFAAYYPDPVPTDELLDLVGLRAVAATPWRHLSGGEQQRLSLALALVGRPEVAFLDEPTAGVDPEGRIAVRAVVAGLKEKGVCVLLTTHELGEAEKMADRIVILSAGRIVLEGTPREPDRRAGRPPAPPGHHVRRARRSSTSPRWPPPSAPGPRSPRPHRAATGSRAPPRRDPAVTAAVATWLAARGAALTDLVAWAGPSRTSTSRPSVRPRRTRGRTPAPRTAGCRGGAPWPGRGGGDR